MGSLPELRSGHIRLSPHTAGNEGLPRPGPYKVGSGSLLLWRMRARPLEGCGKQRASASLAWPSNPFGNWPQPACSVYVRRLGILLSPHPGHTSMNLKGYPHLPAKPAFQSLAQVSPPPCRRAPSLGPPSVSLSSMAICVSWAAEEKGHSHTQLGAPGVHGAWHRGAQ